MLNITLQSCALAMLLVLFCIFSRENSLKLFSRRLYGRALVAGIIALVLDIVSVIAINYAADGQFSDSITKAICKLYVIALVYEAYQGFLYAAGEFFSLDSHQNLRRFYELLFIGGVIVIGVTQIDYFREGRVVYSYGISTTVTYLVSLTYIISSVVMAFIRVEHSSSRRRMAILLWQGGWLLAAFIQLLNPEILLVGFAGAFGLLILYAELENPHEGIDRVTGLFTGNALMDYIADCYQHKRSFSSLLIRVEHMNHNSDFEVQKTIFVRMANFLKETGEDVNIFRYSEMEVVLVYDNSDALDRDYGRITLGLYDAVGMPVRIHYILMQESSLAESADEYFRFHHHYAADLADKELVIIDYKAVDQVREYERVREMIQSALEEHRVEVFYQPFYNVAEERFTSAEALVRIRDEDGSLVPPGVFIPIAEENGLIIPLGEEIFRQVCEFLSTGEPQENGIEYIEYNLSVAQFDEENLAETILLHMGKYNIDPELINLEITETASSSAKMILLRNMRKLMEKGIQFSLDDFGTGRSNLDYFVEMPVEIIKFDYNFTQGYFRNKKAKYVMESMIDMMHKMNLKIVAEGVETSEQLEAMKELGVEFIQGYYFSKPIPQDEFVAFLRTANK